MSKSEQGEELKKLATRHKLKPLLICAEDGELSPNTLRAVFNGEESVMANSFQRVRRAIDSLIAKKTTTKVAG